MCQGLQQDVGVDGGPFKYCMHYIHADFMPVKHLYTTFVCQLQANATHARPTAQPGSAADTDPISVATAMADCTKHHHEHILFVSLGTSPRLAAPMSSFLPAMSFPCSFFLAMKSLSCCTKTFLREVSSAAGIPSMRASCSNSLIKLSHNKLPLYTTRGLVILPKTFSLFIKVHQRCDTKHAIMLQNLSGLCG